MRSTDLLAACEWGDEVRIEQLGWRPVLDALRCWPKRLGGGELAPYARMLGDEDPDLVAKAILEAAGEYRPSAAQVRMRLRPAAAEQRPAPNGSAQRIDLLALAAVRLAVAAGEEICECRPRPTTITVDPDGVLRCPDCEGLEVGQYDAAMEEGDA